MLDSILFMSNVKLASAQLRISVFIVPYQVTFKNILLLTLNAIQEIRDTVILTSFALNTEEKPKVVTRF